MGNNFIRMDEDILADASNSLRKSFIQADDLVSSAPQKFSQIKKTGLFNDGFEIINGQINSVATSLNNISTIIKNSSDKFFELERTFASKAEELEMPTDFVKNDSRKINSIDEITLSKKDGQGVKTYKPGEISDKVEYSGSKEEINEVKDDNETDISVYDSSTSINRASIENIVKDETKEQNFKDRYNIDKAYLENVRKNNTKESEYDDKISAEKTILGNINREKTVTFKGFNDNYAKNKTIIKKVKNDISLDEIDDILLDEMSR